jgi:hypothetical protein
MEERLVSYILGELSEQEQIELESEYFADKEKFKLLESVRDDLMDAYVGGRLSQKQRKQFEMSFLSSPGQQQYVDFAEVLGEYMTKREGAQVQTAVPVVKVHTPWWQPIIEFFRVGNPVLQFSLAAIALLALFGSLWLALETSRLRSQVNQLQAERNVPPQTDQQIAEERARADRIAEELSKERNKRIELEGELSKKQVPESEPTLRSLAFILMPDILRSSGGFKRLSIPSGVIAVELKLDIKNRSNFKNYQAQLSNANGDQIWHADRLKVENRYILLRIPSKLLAEDDYTIDLIGVTADGNNENINTYSFGISKK